MHRKNRRRNEPRHTSHVTRHSSSLWRPHAAQIRHDSVIAKIHGVSQGSVAVAAAQGVRSTRMRSARESCGHLFLAVTSALCSTSVRQVSSPSLERCRGVEPLQTRSKSKHGPLQYINPYFIIIQRGITLCSWRSRLRRSSAELRR